MRHPIITAAAIAAALTISLPAIAQQAPSDAKLGACKAASTTAETIMRARQGGVPVVQLIDAIKVPDGPARDDVLRFVKEAYEQPAWNGKDLQAKAITDFGAAKYVECISR